MQKSAYPDSVKPGIPKLESTPPGWSRVRMGDLFQEISRPAKLEDDKLYELVTVRRSRGGVDSRGVLKGSEIKTKTQFYVAKDDFLISKRQIVHGACGLVPKSLDGAIVSNEYAVLHPTNLVDLHFLKLLSHLNYFQQTCFHSSVGVHVEKMIFKLDWWFKWDVDVPSVPEQKKIVSIISAWDEAIRLAEKKLESSKRLKVGLCQKLLSGDKRLKGFSSDWGSYELGELFSERSETGYEKLELLSISRENGISPQSQTDKKDYSNSNKSKYLRICPGDIGYNTMRMWQGASALSSVEGIVSPAYTIVVPREMIHGKYASYLFKYPPVVHLFRRYSQGLTSDTWNLKYPNFSKIVVKIPPLKEQSAISERLESVDKHISCIESKLSVLRGQRGGLLQCLLSGTTRVV